MGRILMNQKRKIKMIGLDLDGTLLNNRKEFSKRNKAAIQEAIKKGVVVLPATGRPLTGIPKEFLEIEGVTYALSANGAAIYNLRENKKIYEECMDYRMVVSVLEKVRNLPIMADVFIDGVGYVEQESLEQSLKYMDSEEIREYIRKTRTPVDNLIDYIQKKKQSIQKMTINFRKMEDGRLEGKEAVLEALIPYETLAVVSGIATNLEITNKAATKGNGLIALGKQLGIDKEYIMACGDSGNDREMLKMVGFGVAMKNSTNDVIEVADFVTKSNEEDGVACVIEDFVLKSLDVAE